MSKPAVHLQRVHFVVHDLDRALQFYRDILGFEVAHVEDVPADSYSYSVLEVHRNATLRVATLSAPGQPRILALTEIKGVTLKHCPDPKRSAIVVEVADFDDVVRRSVGWGLVAHPERRLHTHDGRAGREQGIVDHDGNLVVVYTITAS